MVKAGTKQVIRAEKWVVEYRRWVGSGLTQRSYCGQVGLIFTQFKSGVEFARKQGMLERANAKCAQESKVMSNLEGFAPVQIKPSNTQLPYCEIGFEGKPSIRIETAASLRCFMDLVQNGVER